MIISSEMEASQLKMEKDVILFQVFNRLLFYSIYNRFATGCQPILLVI
jgi:hypothetical protein